MKCPICGTDLYEYVDVGVGPPMPVAITCCEWGYEIFGNGMTVEDARKAAFEERVRYLVREFEDEVAFAFKSIYAPDLVHKEESIIQS